MEFDLYGVARGLFAQQESGVVTGTVDTPSTYGDLRHFAGSV